MLYYYIVNEKLNLQYCSDLAKEAWGDCKLSNLITIIFFLTNNAFSAIKANIINNLIDTKNFSFSFEQNINGKIETGNCII